MGLFLFEFFILTLTVVCIFLLCFSVLVREVSCSLQAYVGLFGIPS